MRFVAILMIMFALCVPVFAADVDGKWTGNISSPAGDLPVAFTFKADGAKLTGTTSSFDGSEVAITDGKIDGQNITFKVTLDFGGMPFILDYKGVVSPTELKITGEALGMPFEVLLKKAAAAPVPAPAAK